MNRPLHRLKPSLLGLCSHTPKGGWAAPCQGAAASGGLQVAIPSARSSVVVRRSHNSCELTQCRSEAVSVDSLAFD